MTPKTTTKQSPVREAAQNFWIDPDVEVALTAQINEHFPPEGAQLNLAELQAPPALMGRYNRGESREADLSRSFEDAEESQ